MADSQADQIARRGPLLSQLSSLKERIEIPNAALDTHKSMDCHCHCHWPLQLQPRKNTQLLYQNHCRPGGGVVLLLSRLPHYCFCAVLFERCKSTVCLWDSVRCKQKRSFGGHISNANAAMLNANIIAAKHAADERPSRFKKQGLLIVNGCSVQ